MKFIGFDRKVKKLIIHKADRTETFEFKKKTYCTIFTANIPWTLSVIADGVPEINVRQFGCPELDTLEVEAEL